MMFELVLRGLISFGLLSAIITLTLYGFFNPEKVERAEQKGDILIKFSKKVKWNLEKGLSLLLRK
jgi:hypothetical protein